MVTRGDWRIVAAMYILTGVFYALALSVELRWGKFYDLIHVSW